MKKQTASIILGSMLLQLTLFSSSLKTTLADPSPIFVPDDYPSIQEAINHADSGDTIYVARATYNEHLTVDKSNVTIIGEDNKSTVINGSGGDTFLLKADSIRISGFTIMGGFSGIQMSPWTSGHEIYDCIVTDNDFGIRGHYDVHDIAISNNIISLNEFVGVEVCFYDSVISGNVISSNGRGEFIELSAGIEIVEGVYYTTISSNNNTIIENTIESNFNGILSIRYSQNNVFNHNTFRNNTNQFPVSNSIDIVNNRVEENYWSDYAGEDKNGDGFGDAPYDIDAQSSDQYPLMSPFSYWSNPLTGDVNKNMKVDIRDTAIAAQAFGAYPSHPRWKQNADINKDNTIDIRDLALIAKNFGKVYA